MYEFTPFKNTEKLLIESFMKFPRELLIREEYKNLSPNAMLLYTVLIDRLDLSFKQIENNRKIQFHDAKGDMYVIFKRNEIQEKLHLKRTALDTAVAQLKEINLIKEKQQGRNMPNIIYLGKTIGMIENANIEKIRNVQNQQSGMNEINTQECGNHAFHNNYNNKYINNNNNMPFKRKNNFDERNYSSEQLNKLYANSNALEEYKKSNDINDFNELIANKD